MSRPRSPEPGPYRIRRNLQPSDQTVIVFKFAQGGEKLDAAMKWAEKRIRSNAARLNGL